MFIKIKHNQIGYITIIDKVPKLIKEIILEDGETIKEINIDLKTTLDEIKKSNNYIIDSLKSTNKTYRKIINNKINIENITEHGFELIKKYKENPSEANLSILVAQYNKENWNNEIICCGDYSVKINKFINELQLEVGKFAEA
jgi:hypothetical protein